MEQGSKAKKLGRGLSGLIGMPVTVPVPVPAQGGDGGQVNNDITFTQDHHHIVSGGAAARAGDAGSAGGGAGRARAVGGGAPGAGAAADSAPAGGTPYVVVEVERVRANRFQPRQVFDDESLRVLADSIKRDGMMQPLVVRRAAAGAGGDGEGGADWELIAGERRWRAAKLAGLTRVPAVVVDVPDMTCALWAVVENVQRVDLGVMEKATAYARLAKDFGLTQEQIADQVGESRPVVSHYMRINELEPQVRQMLWDRRLSFGHAKVLNSPLVMPGAARVMLAVRTVEFDVSVRQLEAAVNRGAGESEAAARCFDLTRPTEDLGSNYQEHALGDEGSAQRAVDAERAREAERARAAAARFEARANVRDLEEQLSKHLGTKVRIKTSGGGKRGVIGVEFFSLDHFDGLLRKLGVEREG